MLLHFHNHHNQNLVCLISKLFFSNLFSYFIAPAFAGGNSFNRSCDNPAFALVSDNPFSEYEIKPIIGKYVVQHDVLYNAFYDAFSEFTNRNVDVQFVGRNNFLKQPEFSDLNKAKEVLNKFETISEIDKQDDDSDDIKIYIGKDSEISDDTSVIKTKYNYDGEEKTIAIIGPKRMEYDRVVSMLDYIKSKIDK